MLRSKHTYVTFFTEHSKKIRNKTHDDGITMDGAFVIGLHVGLIYKCLSQAPN